MGRACSLVVLIYINFVKAAQVILICPHAVSVQMEGKVPLNSLLIKFTLGIICARYVLAYWSETVVLSQKTFQCLIDTVLMW